MTATTPLRSNGSTRCGAPIQRSARAEELEVLVTLVNAYEQEHHAIEDPSAIAAIAFRMEQQGLTRKDLSPLIGHRARVSEVLNGKRSLSLSMIRRLHAGLGLSADVLIGGGTEARTRPPRARARAMTRPS